MRKLIERLHREKTLSSDEFRILLDDCDDDSLELINSIARSETQKVFGNRIFVAATTTAFTAEYAVATGMWKDTASTRKLYCNAVTKATGWGSVLLYSRVAKTTI